MAGVGLDEAAELLASQIRQVGGGGPVTVVAHSMGGTVLTRAAQQVPELVGHMVHLAAFMPASDVPAVRREEEVEQDPARLVGVVGRQKRRSCTPRRNRDRTCKAAGRHAQVGKEDDASPIYADARSSANYPSFAPTKNPRHICHAMDIATANPLDHRLLFERFLSVRRASLPDIDIDVESARRLECHDTIFDRFGKERVAVTAMPETYRARRALRDTGLALGIAPADVDRIAKSFPHLRASDITGALAELPELRQLAAEAHRYGPLWELAEGLDSLVHGMADFTILVCGGTAGPIGAGVSPVSGHRAVTWHLARRAHRHFWTRCQAPAREDLTDSGSSANAGRGRVSGMTRLLETLLQLSAEEITRADIDHVVHPTAKVFNKADDAIIFRSGRGIYLTDTNGVEWLDACGGQANVAFGYGREDLIEVVSDALKELSYGTLFYGLGTVPAAVLAKKLAEITPGGINRFYYTLGGSDAIETAIKIVRYVNVIHGRPEKTHIIGRRTSYHGTSMGASTMTGDAPMWDGIGPKLPGFSHIDQPHIISPEGDGAKAAQALEDEILRVGPDKVAAFLAEPLSTPAGIYVPPADYWSRIREICDRYDVLWVADEVLTGFGRTGRMFALEHWGVAPDLMTMSKMITSAYFPLAVVGMTDKVATQLDAAGRSFYHGFSAGGHPVACALALATIELYEREDLVRTSAQVGDYFRDRLRELAARHPSIGEIRGIGMITAFDINQDRVGEEFGPILHDRIRAEHMFVRNYKDGQAVGFGPPLTITREEIDEVVRRIDRAVTGLEAERLAA